VNSTFRFASWWLLLPLPRRCVSSVPCRARATDGFAPYTSVQAILQRAAWYKRLPDCFTLHLSQPLATTLPLLRPHQPSPLCGSGCPGVTATDVPALRRVLPAARQSAGELQHLLTAGSIAQRPGRDRAGGTGTLPVAPVGTG